MMTTVLALLDACNIPCATNQQAANVELERACCDETCHIVTLPSGIYHRRDGRRPLEIGRRIDFSAPPYVDCHVALAFLSITPGKDPANYRPVPVVDTCAHESTA